VLQRPVEKYQLILIDKEGIINGNSDSEMCHGTQVRG
jgi:hypothetical protein